VKHVITGLLAIVLVSSAYGEITLCDNGALSAVAEHGAPQAYFYLPLHPSLNAAVVTSIDVVRNKVLIDATLGPGDGPPLGNPNCFFITTTLPGSLEPGSYTVDWEVKRLVSCPSGACQVDSATFGQQLTVPDPLVCSGTGPTFDSIPFPPIAGANIKLLHASSNTTPWVLTDPIVSINGNQIVIAQTGSYTGPPPPPTIYCISTSALVGSLASGDYDVTWELSFPSGTETYHYPLQVLNAPTIPALQPLFLMLFSFALAAGAVHLLSS